MAARSVLESLPCECRSYLGISTPIGLHIRNRHGCVLEHSPCLVLCIGDERRTHLWHTTFGNSIGNLFSLDGRGHLVVLPARVPHVVGQSPYAASWPANSISIKNTSLIPWTSAPVSCRLWRPFAAACYPPPRPPPPPPCCSLIACFAYVIFFVFHFGRMLGGGAKPRGASTWPSSGRRSGRSSVIPRMSRRGRRPSVLL